MATQLSERVKELIAKARIVSFAEWDTSHPAAAIALFQAADAQARYLTEAELQQIGTLAPNCADLLPVAQLLHEQVIDIVDEARTQLLNRFPTITEPGGGLYPPERADACWRDFWHFLRCITYGIAGQHIHYTSPQGLHYMQLLYQELRVPLDAMVVGLEGIKTASLKRVEATQQNQVAPYFDHLIEQLRQFQNLHG
ncbi:phycobilisome protein [Kovacikia minuta CCNUW1]|uniref:phycobilisome protein n=1 Tax=Kovacikia minuta TaxID=2931930 RepID=UPI001CCCB53C|nr:phycobilisome protein [Kovacikia minuta]UBF28196.1 phycobilisome protein [Kovacikia minuta CCNUW1]